MTLILRNLGRAVPTMFAVSIVMFLLLFVGPNPLQQLQESTNLTATDIARLTEVYGWDKPWYVQYGTWVGNIAQGDFGTSMRTSEPALEMIADRLPLTATLALMSMLVSLCIALPAGVVLAIRRQGKLDTGAAFGSFLLLSTPGFLIAVIFQLFAVWMHDWSGSIVFYTGGGSQTGSFIEAFQRLTLPILTLSSMQVVAWMRYQRSETIAVLEAEFLLVARAKGLAHRAIIWRHALRNAFIPIITLAAMDLAHLLGGTVITETVFGLPGVGRLLLESVQARDVVVALDIVVLSAAFMVICTALADVLQAALDPRLREEEGR